MASACFSSSLSLNTGSHVLRSDPSCVLKKPYLGRVALASAALCQDAYSAAPICLNFWRRSGGGSTTVAASAFTSSDVEQNNQEAKVSEPEPELELKSEVDSETETETGSELIESEVERPSPEGTKIYVGNLPWSVDSQQLAQVFQEFGEVEMVEVIYERETGRSRGFGFVTMTTVEGAKLAVEGLDKAELGGRTIKVNFSEIPKSGERPPRREFGGVREGNDNRLYVGNLPWNLEDVGLKQLFSEYGQVLESKVIYDRETGKSRGFGFITYSSASEVSEAISALDGADCGGRALRVNLAADRPPRRNTYGA